MTNQPISVGILGLAHLHPRSYMPHFAAVDGMTVTAVSEANPEVLAGFTKDFAVTGYADWRELLDKEKIDLAVLFLPHCECAEAAVACAERGIHLIVEKPMAAQSDGVRQMIAAAEKAKILLTTAYLWRYHPVSRQMKRFIDEGLLGQIVGCEGRCAAGRLNRYIEGQATWMLKRAMSGGGPMYNLGVHWIDLYRWFLDDEVVEVTGKNVKINKDYDIEDNSFAILTFGKGTVVALDISYTVPDSYPCGRDLHLSMRGTDGVLAWNPSFEGVRESLFLCTDRGEYATSPRRNVEFELTAAPGYCGFMGQQFIRDVADHIRTGSQPVISGLDGLRALEVVEAIYQSAETGRAVQLAQTV